MSVDIAQQVFGSGSSLSGTARLINWRLSPKTEFHLALGVLNLLAAADLWSLQAPFAFPIDDAYITRTMRRFSLQVTTRITVFRLLLGRRA